MNIFYLVISFKNVYPLDFDKDRKFEALFYSLTDASEFITKKTKEDDKLMNCESRFFFYERIVNLESLGKLMNQ